MASETTGIIADRYALALFELADAQNALDSVAADLAQLKAMIEESSDLRRVLRGTDLSRAAQGGALAAVAKAAELSVLTQNFLGLVAKNRRLDSLLAMITSYTLRLAQRRGEVAATVSSAQPLSAAQQDALTAALKSAFGGNVLVHTIVDPSLLGGLLVKVGSRLVDSSLKTKLAHLKLAMKGVA